MAFVRALLLAYDKYRRDPEAALAAAGIPRAQVRKPDARIDVGQLETLSAHAMEELDDEALGWFTRRLPWGTYGMLCRASRAAPTLGVALKRWCRHHALLTTDIVLRWGEARDGARIDIEERVELGAMREFCLLTSLRFVHGYACWLVDSQVPLIAVDFPFPAPPHADVYGTLFPGKVRFGAAATRMTFDPRYMALGPKRDEAALDHMLERALLLTARRYRHDRLLVDRVRTFLREPTHAAATASHIAAALSVSVRSLHRQLESEGASLQHIKDEVRRERAIELLQTTRMPIKQLARAVGFSSDKSFARAFRAWTSLSPSEFRRA